MSDLNSNEAKTLTPEMVASLDASIAPVTNMITEVLSDDTLDEFKKLTQGIEDQKHFLSLLKNIDELFIKSSRDHIVLGLERFLKDHKLPEELAEDPYIETFVVLRTEMVKTHLLGGNEEARGIAYHYLFSTNEISTSELYEQNPYEKTYLLNFRNDLIYSAETALSNQSQGIMDEINHGMDNSGPLSHQELIRLYHAIDPILGVYEDKYGEQQLDIFYVNGSDFLSRQDYIDTMEHAGIDGMFTNEDIHQVIEGVRGFIEREPLKDMIKDHSRYQKRVVDRLKAVLVALETGDSVDRSMALHYLFNRTTNDKQGNPRSPVSGDMHVMCFNEDLLMCLAINTSEIPNEFYGTEARSTQ